MWGNMEIVYKRAGTVVFNLVAGAPSFLGMYTCMVISGNMYS